MEFIDPIDLRQFPDELFPRVLNFLLDRVDDQGRWGANDFDDWCPIITALTVQVLLQAGFSISTKWIVGQNCHASTIRSLGDTAAFLDASINEDGAFGEDAWDTLKLYEIIVQNDLQDCFSNYPRLEAYIDRYYSTREYRKLIKTWDGPGTMAVLARVMQARSLDDQAREIFNELLERQSETGEFHGCVGKDGSELTSPVWHTSQALMLMLDRGISPKDPRIKRGVAWLEHTQTEDGSWRYFSRYDVYFTAYAVLCLSKLPAPSTTLSKAIGWLELQIAPNGKVADDGATIMTALALACIYGPRYEATLRGPDVHNAFKMTSYLRLLQQEFFELSSELKLRDTQIAELTRLKGDLERKIDSSEFTITRRGAFVAAIVVSALIATLSVLGSNVMNRLIPSTERVAAPDVSERAVPKSDPNKK